MHFFLDESGNTGTNWLDTDQPYFVYGGWLVLDEELTNAEGIVLNYSAITQAKELKSSNLIEKRLDTVITLFNELTSKARALPIVSIADKRFMISVKIVETFFDPSYNRQLNDSIICDFEYKTALANLLYVDTTLIEKFSPLIRNGTIELSNMRIIRDRIASDFHNLKLSSISECVRTINDASLLDMIDEYEYLSQNGDQKKWLSLTEPLMNLLLSNIDAFQKYKNEKLIVVPDKIRGYDEVFKMSEAFGNGVLLNYSEIHSEDSKNNKLIQASDLLCGFVARCFKSNTDYSQNSVSVAYWKKLMAIANEFEKDNIRTIGYILPYADINIFAKLCGKGNINTSDPIEKLSLGFTRFLKN